jgi:DNA repair protein RadC
MDKETGSVAPKPHYIGHRERLKERFQKTKGQGIADYELLELLLFYNYARQDTKKISKDLLHEFKNLNTLFHAEHERITHLKGAGGSLSILIQLVGAIADRMAQESLQKKDLINSLDSVVHYAKLNMGFLNHEELRVLFLNQRGQLIKEQTLCIGTINETPIYPREIIRYGLMFGATGMILIHNHPSGDPQPSEEDLTITQQILKISCGLELKLIDHVIVGHDKSVSLKAMGIIS